MAGRKGIYSLLILVCAALALAGCLPPVGNVGLIYSSAVAPDELFVSPVRLIYKVGEKFELNDGHLFVFTSYGGRESQLSLNDPELMVLVIEDASSQPVRVMAAGYTFDKEGPKTIRVEYKTLSPKQYRITVQPNDENQSQASGITWIWEP